jgi:predicted aspartyl protease
LPKINCGPASSVALIRQGATVQIIVRSPVEIGREITLDALIDTGSQLTIIESSCLQGWAPLPIVGPGQFASASGQFSSDILLAEIEIPALHLREVTRIVVADDLSGRKALLGRTQLRNCRLVYDGPKGIVQLEK